MSPVYIQGTNIHTPRIVKAFVKNRKGMALSMGFHCRLLIPILLILFFYIFSMFIWPWYVGQGSWVYVQKVWHSWQGFNVGMLAFFASLIALYATIHGERQKRINQEIAARAFLTEAASDLISYFTASAKVLTTAYWKASTIGNKASLGLELPELPHSYREIFYRYIACASETDANYISGILSRLQVHHSRLETLLTNEFSEQSTYVVDIPNILTKIVSLAELCAMVNRLFDFGRRGVALATHGVTEVELNTALANMHVYTPQIQGLEAYIKRRSARSSS